jgi:hypothetical protein
LGKKTPIELQGVSTSAPKLTLTAERLRALFVYSYIGVTVLFLTLEVLHHASS